MKRIFTMMALAAFSLSISAQSPDLMSYQAILRDASNKLITSQAVSVQISIMQGTPGSVAIYTEVHSVSTNANGLISLDIGDGVSGDDFSTIDWSSGPFFLKTETDPDGGTTYSITSTSQLLSVPFAKYADEAGNAFSGNYADLSGAPTVVSAFGNDVGYLTTVYGTEPVFVGWDKDVSDDFSGNWADLNGAPTNVSEFTNDAGYLSSQYWSQNGSNVYYSGGSVGIGTSTPARQLTVYNASSSSFGAFVNNASGSTGGDGLMVGLDNFRSGYVWNWENAPLYLGTNNDYRMTISGAGDIGIGTTSPDAGLDVETDTKIGVYGVVFNEIREITGTTHASQNWITFTLPTGYTEINTRVLSLEINYLGDRWTGLGFENGTDQSISYMLDGTTMYVYYPNLSFFFSRAFRIIVMRVE